MTSVGTSTSGSTCTHVQLEDSLELLAGDTGSRTEALDARPPLHDTRSIDDRRAEPIGVDARAPLPFERVEVRLVHVLRQPCRVVVGARDPRVPVDDHEGIDPLALLHSGHERHLRPEAVSDEARPLHPGCVHDGDEVVHPFAIGLPSLRGPDMPTPRAPSQSTREKRESDVSQSAMNGCSTSVSR